MPIDAKPKQEDLKSDPASADFSERLAIENRRQALVGILAGAVLDILFSEQARSRAA